MQASSTVQMNIRIESQLKEAGDQVLSLLGWTPSQAVRGFWQYMVANRDKPERIDAVLRGDVLGGDADVAVRRRLEALEEGQRLCTSLGPLKREIADASYEDLRDSMYGDRYARSIGELSI